VSRCALAYACAAFAGCVYPVSPAQCAVDADCPGGVCIADVCHAGTRNCPTLEARFSSINANLFQVGCGVINSGATISTNCHGAVLTSGGSNLDLSSDHAYARLVGIRACNGASTAEAGGSSGATTATCPRRRAI